MENPAPHDASARIGGALLLAAAAGMAVMVIARVAADADRATLAESLSAISESRLAYGVSAGARFASGLALLAGAWMLLRTWIIRRRLGTPAVPYLLGASGLLTAASGAITVVVTASLSPEIASGVAEVPDGAEGLLHAGRLVGKAGFAAAGIALLVAAVYQWRVGGELRKIAPASAVIGAGMQFIWVDVATVMHPIVGTAFFLWLLAVGTMLATGRVERRFIARYGGP